MITSHSTCMYLPCCVVKRVADTFVEVSLVFFGFCCWLTPIPLTVLCVSTCSDGLLDFHITRDGVLRIRLGAHQEHRVNHVARATNRTKVSADVIQLAAHEKDPSPEQAMSEGDASDSDRSESASDSEQNDPPSSLVADAEQYELMQIAYAAVGKDFKDVTGSDISYWVEILQAPEIGDGSREMAIGTVILLPANMC